MVQPLLLSRPFALQVVVAIVLPAVFGLITGVVLVHSEGAYLVLSILGVLGGLAAGFDHLGAGEGALRGICGGALFGSFILLGGALAGGPAKAKLPDPEWVLVVVTVVLGMLFGAIGGALRARREGRTRSAATA